MDDLGAVLQSLRLEHLIPVFQEQQIGVNEVLELNDDEFCELGVTIMGDRVRLRKRCKEVYDELHQATSVPYEDPPRYPPPPMPVPNYPPPAYSDIMCAENEQHHSTTLAEHEPCMHKGTGPIILDLTEVTLNDETEAHSSIAGAEMDMRPTHGVCAAEEVIQTLGLLPSSPRQNGVTDTSHPKVKQVWPNDEVSTSNIMVSVLVCFFNPLFAIIALYFSVRSIQAHRRGDRNKANISGKSALFYSLTGITLATIVIIIACGVYLSPSLRHIMMPLSVTLAIVGFFLPLLIWLCKSRPFFRPNIPIMIV